jgi:hypothetical protein
MAKGKKVTVNKPKKVRVNIPVTAGVTFMSGSDAEAGVNALFERMRANPGNFLVGSDLEAFSSGYMCTGCGRPAARPGPSRCCSAPTIAVELD